MVTLKKCIRSRYIVGNGKRIKGKKKEERQAGELVVMGRVGRGEDKQS